MFPENKLRKDLNEGKIVFGNFLTELRTPSIGKILSTSGLDFFIIDMEHGSYNFETVENILLACDKEHITPIVRVPEIRREVVLKPLDAGALGILIPRVEDKEDVKEALKYIKYAPEGDRGLSTRRPQTNFIKLDPENLASKANKNIMTFVQIETLKGLQNIDSILSIPEIDLLFVGPTDLSFSLKIAKYDYKNWQSMIIDIIKKANKHNVKAGINIYNFEEANIYIEKGLQLITFGTDVSAITKFIKNSLNEFRK